MQSPLEQETLFEEKSFRSFLSFINENFGLELSWYNRNSLQRRLQKVVRQFRLSDLRSLQMLMLRDEKYFQNFVDLFTVQVTELFREPLSLLELRKEVLPFFRDKSELKVLQVGASTGEELSSLCILLDEEGILEESKITSTDLSLTALEKAKRPCISKARIKEAEMNYRKSGGEGLLPDYYQATSSLCFFHESLFKNVDYKLFDLTKDELGQKFDIILCRNLLIYFKVNQQHQLLDRLLRHLNPGGFLILGEQESVSFYQNHENLQIVSSSQKIFRQNLIAP